MSRPFKLGPLPIDVGMFPWSGWGFFFSFEAEEKVGCQRATCILVGTGIKEYIAAEVVSFSSEKVIIRKRT